MDHRGFRRLGFDLSYLALLTESGIKRLSRWEGALSPGQEEVLRDLGLEVTRVRRRLRFGRKTEEAVFSRKPYYSGFYRKRFDLSPIRETPRNMKIKGFLFGYPSCCVESFIREGYAKNGLTREDQRILFHWACPGCKATRPLLREYRAIHDECLRIFDLVGAPETGDTQPSLLHSGLALALGRRAIPAAIGLSAMLLMPHAGSAYQYRSGTAGLPVSADPHLLPVADDADIDYLSFGEEILRGLDAANDDTNENGVIDGVEEAVLLHDLIEALPETAQTDQPYRINHWARGLETCEVCGAVENMGFVEVVNPLRGVTVEVPFICIHYLEHGSLSYAGTYHLSGRLDLAEIKRALLATDESHLTCAYYHYDDDFDADGLGAREEALLATDPGVSDTDGDSVKDGPQFVEGLVEALSSLPREVRPDEPYMIEHKAFGLEACDSCGAILNMGYVEITNPLEGISLEFPFIGLHHLGHGSSAYRGTAHAGRVLPTVLRSVLMGTGTSHWLPVENDSDGDGLKDAEEAHFSLDPGTLDTDGDGLADGPELAMAMARVVSELPAGERPDETYVNHWQADGYVNCLICGQPVDMGMMEIINPVAGTSFNLTYITHHYMAHGSFYGDYPALYRIDPVELDGVLEMSSRASGPVRPVSALPLSVHPNPFRTTTSISICVDGAGGMNIAVYDVSGRRVRDFSGPAANGLPGFGSGDLNLVWDGTDRNGQRLPAGVYFVRMKLEDLSLSRKVVLLE